MTKQLTPEQQFFLDKLLLMRPQTKTPLAGRKLEKIKGKIGDYLTRRLETAEAIHTLEQAHGRQLGQSLRLQLESVSRCTEAGADTGDETAFAVAYAQLDGIKKEARSELARRNAQVKDVATTSDKFEQALAKVMTADGGKQAALAGKLFDDCVKWLAKNDDAVAPRIGAVMETTLATSGKKLTADQGEVLGTQLYNETTELCREIDLVVNRGAYAGANQEQDYDASMQALLTRLNDALAVGRESGSVVGTNKLQLAIGRLTQTQLRANPPPLDAIVTPPVPVDGPGKLLASKLEDLTDEEQADRALLKTGFLLGQAKTECQRIQDGMRETEEALRSLRTEHADRAMTLRDEIDLIANSLTDANAALVSAEELFAQIDQQLTRGRDTKGKKGDWEDALELAAMGCDLALASLSNADKAMGRAEGGIAYVGNKIDAFAAIPRRVDELDEALLDKVTENLTVLDDCARIAPTAGNVDLLRYLAVVSADADKSRALVQGITDPKSYDRQVQALMETPKLGTQLVTQIVSSCHAIVVDAERYFGSLKICMAALEADQKNKFAKIEGVAKQDAARFTIPVVPRKPGDGVLRTVGVAVVGGGPIGLLAAVEARMAGASEVHVYEGRNDPYSRLNVLKIDDGPKQRFKAAGIFDRIFAKPDEYQASVKDIENALEQRCAELGIALERGRFLSDVKRDEKGVVNLTFTDKPDEPCACDFLIVATGGAVASAQKHANNVVLGDKLGIPFQKSAVKDYAAVGVFKNTTSKPGAAPERGWDYQMQTGELKYVVSQLTEEEFLDMAENPRKLVERLQQRGAREPQSLRPQQTDPARDVKSIGKDDLADAIESAWDKLIADFAGIDNFYGKDKAADDKIIAKCKDTIRNQLARTIDARAKKGDQAEVSPAETERSLLNLLLAEFGGSRFPIELQQAAGFSSTDGGAVLIGDSAATPHPNTAKGLNTGVAEMGAMRDLIQDLQRTDGDEAKRKEALQVYDFEVKRRTDMMIGAALEDLQNTTAARVNRTWKERCAVQLKKWRGGQAFYDSTLLPALTQSIAGYRVTEEQGREDRDWSRRETAVKSLRALLNRSQTAATQLENRAGAILGSRADAMDEDLPEEFKTLMNSVLNS